MNFQIIESDVGKTNMKIEMGKLVSNVTIIKDGVDLKERFVDVFENHPLTYDWSDGVKKMISMKLYDEVMKDASK